MQLLNLPSNITLTYLTATVAKRAVSVGVRSDPVELGHLREVVEILLREQAEGDMRVTEPFLSFLGDRGEGRGFRGSSRIVMVLDHMFMGHDITRG